MYQAWRGQVEAEMAQRWGCCRAPGRAQRQPCRAPGAPLGTWQPRPLHRPGAPATSLAGAPSHTQNRTRNRSGGRHMNEPDTSPDIPQALWPARNAIIIAKGPAPDPDLDAEPDPEPEAGS